MSYLFPIKPISEKPKSLNNNPVEKIGDDDRELFSEDQRNEEFKEKKEIDKKIKKMISNEKCLASIGALMAFSKQNERSDNLELSKLIACSVLKAEMIKVVKSFFFDEDAEISEEEIANMSLSEMLSKMIVSYSKVNKNLEVKANKDPKKNYGKAYPLLYGSAGFLVHYCKEILDKKDEFEKRKHISSKINKNNLPEFLKKTKG